METTTVETVNAELNGFVSLASDPTAVPQLDSRTNEWSDFVASVTMLVTVVTVIIARNAQ